MFGSTNAAIALVVAIFMAGLGLGGLLFGRKIDRVGARLRLFGILQLSTAAASFMLYLILRNLPSLMKTLAGSIGTNAAIPLLGLLVVFLMLIPCIMMGSTLPVLTRIWAKRGRRIARGVGTIYATNTLGSVIGAGLTGFLLIAAFGQFTTHLVAVVINFFAGAGAMILVKKTTNPITRDPVREAKISPFSILIVVAGFTGFAALALEILWTRILHIFLANSTYGFTSVVIVFLIGITLGSMFYARFLSKHQKMLTLGVCLAGIGLFVLCITIIINDLPDILYNLTGVLDLPSIQLTLPPLLLAGILAFVPTFLMGISFPLICTLYIKDIHYIGKDVGVIYFINTIGSIIGSLCAAFILIPVVGTVISIIIIGCLYICVGFMLYVFRYRSPFKVKLAFTAPVIIITAFLVWSGSNRTLIVPPSLFRTPRRTDKILYYQETREGTVIVHEDVRTNIRACYINNSAVCGTTYDALKVVKMLGHLPFLIKPDVENALVVGFGIGVTASAVAQHDVLEIDCIEICPGVRDAAQYFKNYNRDVINDERINFIDGDARTLILMSEKKYDVISCDPTHPTLGCNNLYTREYFQLCKDILKKDYVICQYLPLHRVTLEEFRSLIKTFASVFPHTTVWLGFSHGIMVGSPTPLKLDFSRTQQYLTRLGDDILDDPYNLAISLILDENAVRKLTREAQLNTDDFPLLEFHHPHSAARENWSTNLYELMKIRIPPHSVIQNISDTTLYEQYLTAQRYFLSAMIYKNRGELDKMLQALRIAAQINPENTEITDYLEYELRQLGYR
ncbi:MAG: fused MFS/spermidine synthase [candidate division WOR-3 bacterium]|nr:MAG: fused MFS/spermidine synthase [candidate division WOR-3 bacterium]